LVPTSFEYSDTVYRSLSEVARKITGTGRNGPAFFGLRESQGATISSAERRASLAMAVGHARYRMPVTQRACVVGLPLRLLQRRVGPGREV
jgi:hypothetical protein